MDEVTPDLLARARRAGLDVRADGDRLVVRGPRRLEPLALLLLERKQEVLRALLAPPWSASVEVSVAEDGRLLSGPMLGPEGTPIDAAGRAVQADEQAEKRAGQP